jgi:uncharacterized SAM-binding protein YcdF (DUF218 family)
MRRALRRLAVAAALVALTVLGAAASPAPALATRAWTVSEPPRRADVIVVLGGGVTWPGYLMCDSFARLRQGVWLHDRGYAERLLFSGASGGAPRVRPEAEIMREVAVQMGVPPEDIVVEPRALRTWDNGREVAAIMRREGWTSALLVTDALHMRRARRVFARQGIEAVPSPSYSPELIGHSPAHGLLMLQEIGYEAAALLFYRLKGWA